MDKTLFPGIESSSAIFGQIEHFCNNGTTIWFCKGGGGWYFFQIKYSDLENAENK